MAQFESNWIEIIGPEGRHYQLRGLVNGYQLFLADEGGARGWLAWAVPAGRLGSRVEQRIDGAPRDHATARTAAVGWALGL